MPHHEGRKRAVRPEDLGDFFVERANAGDMEGLVALYEPDAVLALPGGGVVVDLDAIRDACRQLLSLGRMYIADGQKPALMNGDLALTSSRLPSGATAQVARRQLDGTWLRIVDRPNVSI